MDGEPFMVGSTREVAASPASRTAIAKTAPPKTRSYPIRGCGVGCQYYEVQSAADYKKEIVSGPKITLMPCGENC
jgi:hypothetical protein